MALRAAATRSSSGAESVPTRPSSTSCRRAIAARARWPQTKDTRVPTLYLSSAVTTTTPTSAVVRGWVPPQGWRSKPSASTIRTSSRTPSGGRRPWARASAAERVEIRTGRASHTISLARRSAARAWSAVTGRSRSMVVTSAPRWKAIVSARAVSTKAFESRCCPWCCCTWSRRRVGVHHAAHAALRPAAGRARGGRPPRPRAPRRRARRRACPCPRAGRRSPRRTRCGRGRRRAVPRARDAPSPRRSNSRRAGSEA